MTVTIWMPLPFKLTGYQDKYKNAMNALDIAGRIRHPLQHLEETRRFYISNEDRLRLNRNETMHNYIHSIYTVAIPEKLIEIFTLLGLFELHSYDDYSVKRIADELNGIGYALMINEKFADSRHKVAIAVLCFDLQFFADESKLMIDKLMTTL